MNPTRVAMVAQARQHGLTLEAQRARVSSEVRTFKNARERMTFGG